MCSSDLSLSLFSLYSFSSASLYFDWQTDKELPEVWNNLLLTPERQREGEREARKWRGEEGATRRERERKRERKQALAKTVRFWDVVGGDSHLLGDFSNFGQRVITVYTMHDLSNTFSDLQ